MAGKERREILTKDSGRFVSTRDIIRVLIEEASDDVDMAYFESVSKRLIIPYAYSLDDDVRSMFAIFQANQIINQQSTVMPSEAGAEVPKSSSDKSSIRDVLCLYSIDEFNLYFRMSRCAVEILYGRICSNLNIATFANDGHDLVNKLLVTLWSLSSTESFDNIGSRFGYSKENLHVHCHQMLQGICSLKEELISWPTAEECVIICQQFEEKYRFPGIIGLVDCFQIPFGVDNTEFGSSTTKSDVNCVALQITCDHTFQFRHIHVTTRLSDHMAVFKESNIEKKLLQDRVLLKKDYHILGGAGYILKDYLLTPYYDNGDLIESQERYNNIHNDIMNITEKSKKLFVNRFRRLELVNVCALDMTLVVMSCCVLHNFILENDDSVDVEAIIEHELPCINTTLTGSSKKRNQIAELL